MLGKYGCCFFNCLIQLGNMCYLGHCDHDRPHDDVRGHGQAHRGKSYDFYFLAPDVCHGLHGLHGLHDHDHAH